MAAYNKFESWVEYANKEANLETDQFTAFLCAAANAPTNTDTVLADLTTIAYTNLGSRDFSTTSSSQTGGLLSLILAPLIVTATGGSSATFRYFGIFDNTVSGDPLVCWADHGANVTLADGQSFVITPDQTNGLFSNS